MKEPGGLLYIRSYRVGHNWSNVACMHAFEKELATHSSILAWRIPGTEEPGGLPSMGSHRGGHDWSNLAAAAVACLSCSGQSLSHVQLSVTPWTAAHQASLSITNSQNPPKPTLLYNSAVRVVSSAYLRLLIFLPTILIPACVSSSPAFLMLYSACKLNKQPVL